MNCRLVIHNKKPALSRLIPLAVIQAADQVTFSINTAVSFKLCLSVPREHLMKVSTFHTEIKLLFEFCGEMFCLLSSVFYFSGIGFLDFRVWHKLHQFSIRFQVLWSLFLLVFSIREENKEKTHICVFDISFSKTLMDANNFSMKTQSSYLTAFNCNEASLFVTSSIS